MDHSLPLISTLVIAFHLRLSSALLPNVSSDHQLSWVICSRALRRAKYTPGVVADAALASQLSEIGVMLLMFGVGLHFSLKDLWSVKSVAVPGAVLQMTIATVLEPALRTGSLIGTGRKPSCLAYRFRALRP